MDFGSDYNTGDNSSYGGNYENNYNNYNANVPNQNRLISPWGYVGYSILFAIPIVGIVLLIIYSFDDTYINRRNYARSFWAGLLLLVILIVVFTLLGFLGAFIASR